MEVSLTGIGELRCRNQNGVCSGQEIGERHFIGLDVLTSWLIDRELHGLGVVEITEGIVGSECVAHELWILLGADDHTDSILEIADVDQPVSDDDAVAGTETFRDIAGKIQPLSGNPAPSGR